MQRIVDSFLKPHIDKHIAVYGTGLNAERVIRYVKGYCFSCVISNDENMLGYDFYGTPIVSISDALKTVDIILIAAIPSSARIVYDRIKNMVPDSIPLFDLSGIQLNNTKGYMDCYYWAFGEKDIRKAIDEHDVISFDAFDTLLMRKILHPRTLFEIVGESYKTSSDFKPEKYWNVRIQAEESLYEEGRQPELREIYDYIKDNDLLDIAADTTADNQENTAIENGLGYRIAELEDLEIAWERKLSDRREPIYNAFNYALLKRKKVYIVSDMYLTKSVIDMLLSQNEISGFMDILVSCEQGCNKGSGELFIKLKNLDSAESILHIGDSYEADVEGADKVGIESFHVFSPERLLLSSSIAHIGSIQKNKWDELLLGHILSDLPIFNNPFELGNTKGRICFDSVEMLTELCIVPITIAFMSWIIRELRGQSDSVVLFVSRDGFLLEQIYRDIRVSHGEIELPESAYFYTSRKAMQNVIPYDDKGIEYLCRNLNEYRKVNVLDHLEKVFGIELKDDLKQYEGMHFDEVEINSLITDLKGIRGKIFEHAVECRGRYKKYVETLKLNKYKKIYLVDLVSQGTSRYGLSSMLGTEVTMLSLGSKTDLNTNSGDKNYIKSMFRQVVPGVGGAVGSMFTLLEMAYASEEGQVKGFSDDGMPLKDAGTAYNKEALGRIQNTIKSFIASYADDKWFLREYSKGLVESMLGILHPEYSDVTEEVRELFGFYDPLRETAVYYNVLNDVRGDIG